MASYGYDHNPADTFVVAFDDKTADERTRAQMDAMIQGMRDVANRYGFDINAWGALDGMRAVLNNG